MYRIFSKYESRQKLNNTIRFPTMDAINYSRMMACNAMNMHVGMWHGYPQTELDVPRSTTCPCCHKVTADDLIPIMAINNAKKNDNGNFFECDTVSIYRCSSCNNLYAIWSKHIKEETDDYSNDSLYDCKINAEYPFSTNVTTFSSEIQNLSPDFATTYNQSELAENQGLDLICGMGYRKSLEFLIDAFIKHSEHVDTIPERELQKKIQNHLTNTKVKTLAEKATWLGNDAAHIENKHPDRSVSDMKNFIIQIVKWIDFELSVEDAETIEKK